MKNFSLRIERLSGTLFGLWIEDRSALGPANFRQPPARTFEDGSALYQALAYCMLEIRAGGGTVQYIDLPANDGGNKRERIGLDGIPA